MIIAICGVTFAVAVWVMMTKAVLVRRIDRGNNAFLEAFRVEPQVLLADGAARYQGSSRAHLYDLGVTQFNVRKIGQPGIAPVSGATLNAVIAAVTANLVRENQKLNARMVLMTVAISGGP